jgi:hypothetical protein
MFHNLLQKISNLLPYWKSMNDVTMGCSTEYLQFHISQNQSLYTSVYQRIRPLVFCEHSLVVTC